MTDTMMTGFFMAYPVFPRPAECAATSTAALAYTDLDYMDAGDDRQIIDRHFKGKTRAPSGDDLAVSVGAPIVPEFPFGMLTSGRSRFVLEPPSRQTSQKGRGDKRPGPRGVLIVYAAGPQRCFALGPAVFVWLLITRPLTPAA